jgi:hypothetical protein
LGNKKEQLCLASNLSFAENSDAGRVVLSSARRLRSKLNHAVEATDVKLAASKTALGLQYILTFPNRISTDN